MEKEKKTYGMKKIDFSQVEIPSMYESFNRKPWTNYGHNNTYPQYLIEQYNHCAIHKAVVTAKRELIVGDGLVSPNKPMAVVSPVNGSENVEDVFRKCALDYVLFGGFAINVIWSRDHKSIAEIYHMDFSRIRAEKANEEDKVENYYYSMDWTNLRKYKPEKYPAFNQDNSEPSQILYHFEYSPNLSYYPIPDYSGGLAAINIDIQIKDFHNNNLRNGMNPSLFISMNNGIPSEDEQFEITNGLEQQFSSSMNAGKAIISFNEDSESAPQITQIGTNGNDEYYKSLYEDVTRSILSSHRVSSAELFGIATPGKLGAADEIIQHSEFFRNTVIKPYQQELLPVFNKVMSLKYEEPIKLQIKPLSILELDDKQADKVE